MANLRNQPPRPERKEAARQELIAESNELFAEFLGIIERVWGHRIEPHARCEKCELHLTLLEIFSGFTSDPSNFTTACPRCTSRVGATLLVSRKNGQETIFFGRAQVLERLPGKEMMDVEAIRTKYPDVFYSSLVHFGSLLNAFRAKNLHYSREKFDWTKGECVLGNMIDRDVADIFGLSAAHVAQMRKDRSIKASSRQESIIPANRRLDLSPPAGEAGAAGPEQK